MGETASQGVDLVGPLVGRSVDLAPVGVRRGSLDGASPAADRPAPSLVHGGARKASGAYRRTLEAAALWAGILLSWGLPAGCGALMAIATEYASAASGTSWTNATNANADDGAYATYVIAAKNTTGNVNTLSDFGFDSSIPVGATINSVELVVEHKVSTTSGIAHLEATVAVSGTPGTYNTDSTEPTTDTQRTYSSLARPGGGSWTRNDLLDGTFTVLLRARSGNNATSVTYSWDYARVNVDYTVPAAVPVLMHEYARRRV